MKIFFVFLVSILFVLDASASSFDNAFELEPDFLGTLLQGCQSLKEGVSVSETSTHEDARRVIVQFGKSSFSHIHSVSFSIFDMLLSLNPELSLRSIESTYPVLRDVLNEPNPENEYIICGYGAGGSVAAVAAWRIFQSICRCSSDDHVGFESVKDRNQVKLIAFYPRSVPSRLSEEITNSLGILNCAFFQTPLSLGKFYNFPGIGMDVIKEEYLRDNEEFFLSLLTTPFLVYFCKKDKFCLQLRHFGIFFLQGNLRKLSDGVKLSTASIKNAYIYTCENIQMYEGLHLYDAGRVPFFSVRRGVLSRLYKMISG